LSLLKGHYFGKNWRVQWSNSGAGELGRIIEVKTGDFRLHFRFLFEDRKDFPLTKRAPNSAKKKKEEEAQICTILHHTKTPKKIRLLPANIN
jgi:hypothetical protein